MTEEPTSGLQNWKLLVIALVLAVVAAIVYNIHINQIREAAKGHREGRLVYKRDIQFGEKITLADIEEVQVDTEFMARFDRVVTPEDRDTIIGKPVNQKVTKDHWLLWSNFQEDSGKKPSEFIKDGTVAHTIDVNPQMTPGDMLRVGDRVNIHADLPENITKKVKAITIIEGVKVLAIGGRTVADHPIAGRGETNASSYRSLTVELPQNVALKLENVLKFRTGAPWVDLCPSGTALNRGDNIDLTKEVKHLESGSSALVAPG